MPNLIALYAPVMASGKSEIADRLVRERGYRLVKFATPIKEMVRTFLRMTDADEVLIERMLEGDLKEATIPGLGKSTRELFQTLGTDWGRLSINPDMWVNLTRHTLLKRLSEGSSVVIDDLRFPNELRMVESLGGWPLRVVRPGALKYNAHQSESLLDSYPMPELINQGTLEQLHSAALQVPEFLARHYQ